EAGPIECDGVEFAAGAEVVAGEDAAAAALEIADDSAFRAIAEPAPPPRPARQGRQGHGCFPAKPPAAQVVGAGVSPFLAAPLALGFKSRSRTRVALPTRLRR